MKTGLLWYDGNPKVTFASKVVRAARRYRERFGRQPSVCYVHPSMLADISPPIADVQILPSNRVQRNCFWVGIKEL